MSQRHQDMKKTKIWETDGTTKEQTKNHKGHSVEYSLIPKIAVIIFWKTKDITTIIKSFKKSKLLHFLIFHSASLSDKHEEKSTSDHVTAPEQLDI